MRKIITFIIILLAFLPFTNIDVKAASNDSTITYQRIDGVYFYQRDSKGNVSANHVTKFFMNNEIVYCIEPLTAINDKIYDSTTDWAITKLTDEQIDKIEKIGYFGYEYQSHNTDRYWLAAQELIWETVRPDVEVKYTTQNNGQGSEIDLTKEKNEILDLVNNYNILPSFADSRVEGNMGSEITLNDTNNVLSEFDLTYTGKHTIDKNGSTLTIKFANNEITDETLTFSKKNYDNKTTLIYYKNDSQKLASLRISNPASFTLNIKSHGGKITVDKFGEKINYSDASYSYENIKLPDAVFGIYANEDIVDSQNNVIYKKYELVDTIKTNEEGVAILDNVLFGKYFITELESNLNNMIDSERYYFEITPDDLVDGEIIEQLKFQNFLAKGKLIFTKTDFLTGEAISDTEIMIFTEDDRLIYTGKTDSNGKIVIDNLLANQRYYIIEKTPSSGYKLNNNKIYFEINENGQVVKVNMTNEKIIEVPDTESNSLSFVYVIITLIGIGVIIYEVKKIKKKK